MIIRHHSWYKCPTCNYRWEDEQDSSCNDTCPNCGEHDISPECSEEVYYNNDGVSAC